MKHIVKTYILLALALPFVLFTNGCAKSKEKYIEVLEGKGYIVTEKEVPGTSKAESMIEAVSEKGYVRLSFYKSHKDSQEGYNKEKQDIAMIKSYSPNYDYQVFWVENVVMVGNAQGIEDAK